MMPWGREWLVLGWLAATPERPQVLMIVLLVVLPYGTAIICGAITEWAGRLVSGYCSLGGLALGIYFFSKSMALLMTG